jgi:hypothetical protein
MSKSKYYYVLGFVLLSHRQLFNTLDFHTRIVLSCNSRERDSNKRVFLYEEISTSDFRPGRKMRETSDGFVITNSINYNGYWSIIKEHGMEVESSV